MTPKPQQWYTLREIARMVGYSKRTIQNAVRAGTLKATRRGCVGPGFNPAYIVHRAELARWLIASGAPTESICGWLNPEQWVILVGCEPALQSAIGGRTRLVPTLYHLGEEIHTRPAWAAVVDLPAVGTAEACRALVGLAARPDRPRLIGLFDDSEAGVDQRAVAVFDNLFPRSAGPAALARGILYLSPGLRASDLSDPHE